MGWRYFPFDFPLSRAYVYISQILANRMDIQKIQLSLTQRLFAYIYSLHFRRILISQMFLFIYRPSVALADIALQTTLFVKSMKELIRVSVYCTGYESGPVGRGRGVLYGAKDRRDI